MSKGTHRAADVRCGCCEGNLSDKSAAGDVERGTDEQPQTNTAADQKSSSVRVVGERAGDNQSGH